jgi:hypothetical protein
MTIPREYVRYVRIPAEKVEYGSSLLVVPLISLDLCVLDDNVAFHRFRWS